MNAVQPITCCKGVPGVAAHDVADALLSHMLVTEYYDGAISGFVQCPVCRSVYHFVTLDWTPSHLVRVIALSLLPADSMTRLVSFFSEAPPRGQWIPKILQRATDQDLDRIEAFLSEITAKAEPPSLVLAWNVITTEILAARKISALTPDHFISLFDLDARAARERADWFGDLGVARDS